MNQANNQVLLGMSGGTDSSVAALKLQEAGYQVIGVTFRFYESGDEHYIAEARTLAHQLGIEHITYDARSLFKERIIRYFIAEYMAGRTPVPCTYCNNWLKWPLLLQLADERGIYWVATGHYARKTCVDGRYYLIPAVDADKDQTFFLWGLNQSVLQRMLLPMGDWTKSQARAYATARGHHRVAQRKDSLGVCFCPMDYRSFLRSEVPSVQFPGRGRYVDEAGQFLGWHEGYPFYTIGQRRRLGIHLNRAVFVKEIHREQNEVVLAPLSSLYKTEMWLKEWHLIAPETSLHGQELIVKIRYRKQANRCRLHLADNGQLQVTLLDPLEAVAPGQAAAFYDTSGKLCGGGIIV